MCRNNPIQTKRDSDPKIFRYLGNGEYIPLENGELLFDNAWQAQLLSVKCNNSWFVRAESLYSWYDISYEFAGENGFHVSVQGYDYNNPPREPLIRSTILSVIVEPQVCCI